MSTNNINKLQTPTINGLGELTLDQLTSTDLKSENFTCDNMKGNMFNIETIEAYTITVGDALQLSSTGYIIVGANTPSQVIITDDQIKFLSNMTSNIQNQIDNISIDISNDLIEINNKLDENETEINNNTFSINTNSYNISTNVNNITSNTNNISINTNNILTQTNRINNNIISINANTSDITTQTNRIDDNVTSINNNTNAINTNTSNITTQTNRIDDNVTSINNNVISINTNTSAINTNASNITNQTTRIDNNITSINNNTTSINANTSDISTLYTNTSYLSKDTNYQIINKKMKIKAPLPQIYFENNTEVIKFLIGEEYSANNNLHLISYYGNVVLQPLFYIMLMKPLIFLDDSEQYTAFSTAHINAISQSTTDIYLLQNKVEDNTNGISINSSTLNNHTASIALLNDITYQHGTDINALNLSVGSVINKTQNMITDSNITSFTSRVDCNRNDECFRFNGNAAYMGCWHNNIRTWAIGCYSSGSTILSITSSNGHIYLNAGPVSRVYVNRALLNFPDGTQQNTGFTDAMKTQFTQLLTNVQTNINNIADLENKISYSNKIYIQEQYSWQMFSRTIAFAQSTTYNYTTNYYVANFYPSTGSHDYFDWNGWKMGSMLIKLKLDVNFTSNNSNIQRMKARIRVTDSNGFLKKQCNYAGIDNYTFQSFYNVISYACDVTVQISNGDYIYIDTNLWITTGTIGPFILDAKFEYLQL